jgi:ATP-dependent Clp endopeptidase proteolytic subunit ClpP
MAAKKFKIIAKGNKVEVFLYGAIENDEQAHLLGIQLKMYEDQYSTCVVRTNSIGGNVLIGLAMWNLLLSSKMDIEFIVDGVAASMAAVLLMLPGAKVFMARYAKMMLHRVHCGGEGTVDDIRDTADMAEALENDLIDAISKRTGKTVDEVRAKWFDGRDHWLSAEQALAEGLIDGIVDGDKSISLPENLSNAQSAYTYFNNLLNTEQMEFKNKAEFCTSLGIDPKSSDEAVLTAALKALGEKTTLTNQVSTLTTDKTALQTKLDAFEKKEKDTTAEEKKTLFDNAVSSKRMTAEMRTHYEALFDKDPETTKAIVASLPSIQTLNNLTNKDLPEDRKGWTFKDWQKKDSKGLAEMKKNSLESFKSLYKPAYDKDYKDK